MKAVYRILTDWRVCIPALLRNPDLDGEVQRWVDDEFSDFARSRAPLYFGAAYAPFAVAAFYLGGAFRGLSAPEASAGLLIMSLASFVCGLGLCSILYLARFVWRLGRFPVRVTTHSHGVLSVGEMLLRCNLIIAAIWCAYTGSGTWSLSGRLVPLSLLAAPAVLYIIGAFITCQLPLRARMLEHKRERLLQIESTISSLTPQTLVELSAERRAQLEFLNAELDRVSKWPEWPFTWRTLAGVTGAAIGAVAPPLVNIVLTQAFGPTAP